MPVANDDGLIDNLLTITHAADSTAFRFLLISLVRNGVLPKAEARLVASYSAAFVRSLKVIPELAPITEATAKGYDSMIGDHADG